MKPAPKIFDLKGEHGFGKHVLVFSFIGEKKKLAFENLVPREWKFLYFNIDINEDLSGIEHKFMHTLHHYNYAKYLILDYPAFLVLSYCLERVFTSKNIFERIIIFNPIKFEQNWYDFLFPFFEKSRYISLDGDIISLPDKYLARSTHSENFLDSIKANEVFIIGLQDNSTAFHLSSKIKNVEFRSVENYGDAIKSIVNKF